MTSRTASTHPSPRRRIRLLFTGLSMGLADLVPGVSGGTIALLFGIYDELLYTVKLVTGRVPKLLLSGKFAEAWQLIPFGFLLPLVLGMGLAIFGLVYLVEYLLEAQPVFVWALFFGLVLGSAYIVSRRVTAWTPRRILLLLAGFIVTFIIVSLPSIGGSDSPLAIFATGAIAITAMILPGISGSLIMVMLGQYEIVIDAVAARDVLTLGFFAIGALLGLAVFARVLTWLLKHYHLAVIACLVGVMLGSLRRIWPWQTEDATNLVPSIDASLLLALLLTVVGFLLVIMLERVGLTREHDDIHTREFKRDFKEIEG